MLAPLARRELTTPLPALEGVPTLLGGRALRDRVHAGLAGRGMAKTVAA